MPLVNNVGELQELLSSMNITVTSVDQLRELLLTLQQADSNDPAARQAWATAQARQEALAEKTRDQEHAERMRALELGHPLPDPEAVRAEAGAIKATAAAAALLGSAVVFVAVGCSVGATAIILHFMHDAGIVPVCLLWLVCGGVCFATALGSLTVLNKLRLDLKRVGRPAPPPPGEGPPVAARPMGAAQADRGQYWERKHES